MKPFNINTVAMARLTAKDYVYFNSREENRMRETFPILHNIALQYAMKNVVGGCGYRMHDLVPTYVEDFERALHQFYIYPAVPSMSLSRNMQVSERLQASTINTIFGWQSESYRTFSEQTSNNLLQYTDVKLLEPGNEFITFITSEMNFEDLRKNIPHYIRLGKLMSTVEMELVECKFNRRTGEAGDTMTWYINPIDIAPTLKIGHDYISSLFRMNPCDLLHHITLRRDGAPLISITMPDNQHVLLPACHHFQALPRKEGDAN